MAIRRFEVWLDKNVPGMEPIVQILTFPSGTSWSVIDEECAVCLETMIANELDTGWRELKEDE